MKDNGTTVDALAKQNVNTETNRQAAKANTLAFSETDYWNDPNKYETKNAANVFDSNSLLYAPVQNYKTYLKNTLGKTSIDVRLITYEELTSLGCNMNEATCESAPSWVYSTRYWTASTYTNNKMWVVFSNGYCNYGMFNSFNYLRPVITISKSEI